MRKTGKFFGKHGEIVASSHDYVMMTYAVITFKCYYQTNNQKSVLLILAPPHSTHRDYSFLNSFLQSTRTVFIQSERPDKI